MLTAEDIRYARNIDLAAVTEIDPSNFAAWSNSRGISERNLNLIAQRLGISKLEFMQGLELRRQDAAITREVAAKFEKLIALRGVA